MGEVSPVQVGAEAMAQLLALTVSKSVEQATKIAVLSQVLGHNIPSSGTNPEGVGQLLDLMA